MTYEQLRALYDQRAAVWERSSALLEDARERDWTGEDDTAWEALDADLTRFDREIDHAERERSLEARADVEVVTPETAADATPEERYATAYDTYLRDGIGSLDAPDRDMLASRAQSIGTDTAGGYLGPPGFWARIVESMEAYSNFAESANVLVTETGNTLEWPTSDDTSNKGQIIGENTQVSEQDVTFGSKSLGSYTYTSNLIRVSNQLLQDAAFNVEEFLARKLGERLGRIQNDHWTTGTGSGQPDGVLVGATSGLTTASATAITHDELIDLQHSVDPSYRGMNSQFMFNDTTLGALRKIVDGDGNLAWAPGLVPGTPGTLLGTSYIINQSAPNMATGNVGAIAYGDFNSGYVIRQVRGVQIMRLAERYADYLQVGFLAYLRMDATKDDLGAYRVTTQA